MKSLLVTFVGCSFLALTACQSSSVGTNAEMQPLDMPGAQGRLSMNVPREYRADGVAYSTHRGPTNLPDVHAPNAVDR